MAWQAARNLITALPHSIAVIREAASSLADDLQAMGFQLVCCQHTHLQMSDSLKLGIQTAQQQPIPLRGVVIALADMPYIQPATIAAVAAQLTEARIVQPVFEGQPGHPVGFAADLFPALLQIEGDQGARTVVQAHQQEVMRWACEDAGILKDIDTPQDLA